jgi:hypothetical protein
MVIGPPYTYERVLQDSRSYPKFAADGTFPAWWETYLHDEGFETHYCHFNGLYALAKCGGNTRGILGMDIPHLNAGHIVAVDEIGVVDPADNAPNHISIPAYVLGRLNDAVIFHKEWLAVRMRLPNLTGTIANRES